MVFQKARRLPFAAERLVCSSLQACCAGGARAAAVAVGWASHCPSPPLHCPQAVEFRPFGYLFFKVPVSCLSLLIVRAYAGFLFYTATDRQQRCCVCKANELCEAQRVQFGPRFLLVRPSGKAVVLRKQTLSLRNYAEVSSSLLCETTFGQNHPSRA